MADAPKNLELEGLLKNGVAYCQSIQRLQQHPEAASRLASAITVEKKALAEVVKRIAEISPETDVSPLVVTPAAPSAEPK